VHVVHIWPADQLLLELCRSVTKKIAILFYLPQCP
jgi:hypothetical protein